jgi:release factor glutamine methyltransferase
VPPTVAELLRGGTERLTESGSETARLDAELLLAHALGIERTGVLAHPEVRVGNGQAMSYQAMIDRRAAGEPVAYIRGIKEFHGLAFAVDPRVLIPRPDTELLVDLAEARVRHVLAGAPRPEDTEPFRIWDVGTGSGAIAIAIAVSLRRKRFLDSVRIIATDASVDSLAVAVENAVSHGVADRIELRTADLLDAAPIPAPVDLLVANLPYIPSTVVPALPIAASFEPAVALDGGPDGLVLIGRLIAGLRRVLVPGGQALLEIGPYQVDGVRQLAEHSLPGWPIAFHADLGGRPRVIQIDAIQHSEGL